MGVLDNIKDKVKQIFNFNKSNADFLQYIHIGVAKILVLIALKEI